MSLFSVEILGLFHGSVAGCPLPCETFQTETEFLLKDPVQYPYHFRLAFDPTLEVTQRYVYFSLGFSVTFENIGDQNRDDKVDNLQFTSSGRNGTLICNDCIYPSSAQVGGCFGFWLGLGVLQILGLFQPIGKMLGTCKTQIKTLKRNTHI